MAVLENEKGSREETGSVMKVASALLLLGVGGLAFLSGATAQTCTPGRNSVAVIAGSGDHSCAILVSCGPSTQNSSSLLQSPSSRALWG